MTRHPRVIQPRVTYPRGMQPRGKMLPVLGTHSTEVLEDVLASINLLMRRRILTQS